jgi:hypothetical protein
MTMTHASEASGSGTIEDAPSRPRVASTGTTHRVMFNYERHAMFSGARYKLGAAQRSEMPDRVRQLLLEEGYREQAEEALWIAETSIAAAVEELPEP